MSALTNMLIGKCLSSRRSMMKKMLPTIRAAQLMADAIQNGNRIFGFGCTHSCLPIQEVVYRAGSLNADQPYFSPGYCPP